MITKDWMTQEERLILLLCRLNLNENYKNSIEQIVENLDIDLEYLESLAEDNFIYPQLLNAISKTSLKLLFSEERREKQNNRKFYMQIENLRYTSELQKIAKAFFAEKIPVLTIKGISYYEKIYAADQRDLGDIDLVVDPKDVVRAVHCMESLGYYMLQKNMGWTDEQFEEEIHKTLHVAQMGKESGFEVEIHAATYYYTGFNLRDVMDRSIRHKTGIEIPNDMDVFLMACVHAWHHYPLRRNPLPTHFNRLRHILDVYEGYRSISMDYSRDEIMTAAKNNNIDDIVCFMVHVAYYMLDESVPDLPFPRKELELLIDWDLGNLQIDIARRFFRREEAASLMLNAFRRNMYEINIKTGSQFSDLPYELKSMYHDNSGRWGNNLLEAGTLSLKDVGIRFDIFWEESYLTFIFQPFGSLQWNDCKKFDYFLTHLIMRLGTEYEKEPVYLVLQKDNEGVNAYQWPRGEEWEKRPLLQKNVKSFQKSQMYICKIPCSVMEVDSFYQGMQFYFDLQAHLAPVRESTYVDVCWNGGNSGCMWNEIKDCSYLNVMKCN